MVWLESAVMLPTELLGLFPDDEAAAAWWRQVQCHLYTAAFQLWHEEEDASTLLYGGELVGHWSTLRLTGVIPRLHNALERGWRPPTLARLEGFLWSRLRFEYRTLLSAISSAPPISLPERGLEQLVETLAVGADPIPTDEEALLSLADGRGVEGLRKTLAAKPDLLATVDTLADLITTLEESGDEMDEGWRKRLLGQCAERLGVSLNALHKRLERIRQSWRGG